MKLTIRTPEGTTFALPLAGPVSRCLAVAVDQACVMVAAGVLGQALTLLGVLSPGLAAGLWFLAYFALSMGYGIALEWFWRGQTVGKRLLKLRVVDRDGLKLRPDQIVVRNLLRAVDSLPGFYLLGGVVAVANSRRQRLGDLAANTVVVRAETRPEPDLDNILAGKFNSLAAHPHLAARLRSRAGAAEARLALEAVLRRDELDDEARVRLFADLAAHFRALVAFPDEVVEEISDERYVRNVVDVLLRSQVQTAA